MSQQKINLNKIMPLADNIYQLGEDENIPS